MGRPGVDLLFVHVPKCAGESIRSAVKGAYGDRLLLDYGDRPIDLDGPMHCDRRGFLAGGHERRLAGKAAVFGHFWIRKYDRVDAAVRATVLRHPLDRLISHYFYWRATSPRISPDRMTPVRRRFVRQQPSILEFASYRPMRRFYRACYFPQTDMRVFDYIGEFEDVAEHWDVVLARLGIAGPKVHLNSLAQKGSTYDSEKAALKSDPTVMGRLTDFLTEEIDFYERWVQPI